MPWRSRKVRASAEEESDARGMEGKRLAAIIIIAGGADCGRLIVGGGCAKAGLGTRVGRVGWRTLPALSGGRSWAGWNPGRETLSAAG